MVAPKTNKIILDSSVWIAFIHTEDSQHAKATKLLQRITKTVIVPEYVLLEVATVLRQKKKYVEAIQFAKDIVNNPTVYMPSTGIAKLTTKEFAQSPKSSLSFIDTALLILSKEYEIITFDKALSLEIEKFH